MNHAIRLIATDLDGSLLDNCSRISPYNLSAIRKAQAKGIIFAACTGRFPENAAMVMLEKGIECPVISLNGSVIEMSLLKDRIFEKFLSPRSAEETFEALERLGEGYHIFGKGTVVSRHEEHKHHSELDFRRKDYQNNVRYEYGLQACKKALMKPVYKYFIYLRRQSKPPEVLRAELGNIEGASLTQSGEMNMEVIPSDADKGSGLKMLSERLGIRREEIMAVGDQLNDLPMLRFAGIGVAVANAPEMVRQAADAVTDRNDQDGVGKAIEKYCFSS